MTETENVYVSSRGILKSCDYHSYNPVSSINKIFNYPPISTIKNIQNPSIYICGNAIKNFIDNLLPSIKQSFILVSGDCDETIPNEILEYRKFKQFLNDDRLIHWFSQNMTSIHKKITKIPIGLDYHTLTTTPLWGPIKSCKEQEKTLLNNIKNSQPFWKRQIKCYANFHFSVNTKLGYDRKDAIEKINKEIVYYEPNKVSRDETWNNQKEFAFVICPHGGGLDCHRNWEALCLGCIPIVKSSKIDSLYENLPVLIVDDWKLITKNLLNSTVNDFRKKWNNDGFNMEKLKLSYWVKLINEFKK